MKNLEIIENKNGNDATQPTPATNKARQPHKPLEKSEALQLLKTGLTQKEVSERVGVTEKTVGNWAKEYRHAQKIEADTLANLKNRLLEMSIDKTTPIQDIVNLLLVIEQLEDN